jgi:hypothetical protein
MAGGYDGTSIMGHLWRVLRIGWLCVLALSAAVPTPARDARTDRFAEPRFLIETITVDNALRFSPHIIISESLLQTGQEYSESELRRALNRIRRLPLILDADLSLRKGTARGRYELVITVEETRRWFFGLDADVTWWGEPISVSGLTTTGVTEASSALIGRRFSSGRHGVFFVAAGGNDGTLQGGYTHYNLLGRNVLLGVSFAYADCATDPDEVRPQDAGGEGCRTEVFDLGLDPTFSTWSIESDSWRSRLALEVPIGGARSLRLLGSYRSSDFGIRRPAFEPDPSRFFSFSDRDELELNLSWVHNSLDDPVFPSQGVLLAAGLNLHAMTTDLAAVELGSDSVDPLPRTRATETGLLATGARHWPITRRQSLSARALLFLGHSRIENVPTRDLRLLDDELRVWRSNLAFGHALSVYRVHDDRRWRHLRWENELELIYSATSPHFDQHDNPFTALKVGTGLTFRNRWGVFRIRLLYMATGDR